MIIHEKSIYTQFHFNTKGLGFPRPMLHIPCYNPVNSIWEMDNRACYNNTVIFCLLRDLAYVLMEWSLCHSLIPPGPCQLKHTKKPSTCRYSLLKLNLLQGVLFTLLIPDQSLWIKYLTGMSTQI